MSSAAHLRFDIPASSLPGDVKQRLLALADQRITAEGVVVIKAQTHCSRASASDWLRGRLRCVCALITTVPSSVMRWSASASKRCFTSSGKEES